MLSRWAVLISLVVAVKSNDECGGGTAMRQCLELSESPDFTELDAIPDEDFLDEHCSPLITKGECMKDQTKKCLEFSAYAVEIESTLNLGLEFLHSLCDEDSELKKRYVANVECYNSVFPQMLECANTTNESVDDFFKSIRDDPETEDIIRPICLSKPMLFTCVVEETATVCGEEATDPLRNVCNQLSSIIIQAECPDENELEIWQERYELFVLDQAFKLQE